MEIAANWGKRSGVTFLLAHLSDAHIGPIPRPNLNDLLNKRVTGYVNWLIKRGAQHDMGVLARLVADLAAQNPDHVAMTGDVVNIGLEAEIAHAREWLETLGAPQDVSFTAGNHDAYVAAALPALAGAFAPWTAGDDAGAGYPYLRRRGEVALIGLNSGAPTAPFIASGRLGEAQLAALAGLMEQTRAEGLARIVLIHHPPQVGGARMFRGLDDATAFEAVIGRHGAELVLHGHNHRRSAAYIPGAHGPVPVVGAASASARPGGHYPEASYNLFEISRDGGGWSIKARSRGMHDGGEEGVVDLGAIAL